MKHFLVTNLNRQHIKPFTVTERGLKEIQNPKAPMKHISVIGECDANGNLLKDLAAKNFTPPVDEKKAVAESKPDPIPETKGEEFHEFKETLNEAGKEPGTADKGTDAGKSGKKAGAKKAKKD